MDVGVRRERVAYISEFFRLIRRALLSHFSSQFTSSRIESRDGSSEPRGLQLLKYVGCLASSPL